MKKYRIVVEQIGDTEDETLFEIVGGASLMQGVVPSMLDAVLREVNSPPASADAVFEGAVASGVAAGALPAGTVAGPPAVEPPKPARKRRTKAEIAADELAAAQQHPQPAAAPVAPAEPAQPVAVPDGVIVPEQASPAAPAAPYNPFAVA